MNESQLEQLARDIEDLKRSVRRNSPILHDVMDMKGWELFSLLVGLAVSAFALGAHLLVSAYGSFDRIPAPWQAGLWTILAIASVGSGAVKLLMFTRLTAGGGGGGNLGRIWLSFYGGSAKHVHLPLFAMLVIVAILASLSGHPWFAVPGIAILLGLWCNILVLQTSLKSMLALGYWAMVTGIASLAWIETAPFLWVFIIFGGMLFVFSGAIHLQHRTSPTEANSSLRNHS